CIPQPRYCMGLVTMTYRVVAQLVHRQRANSKTRPGAHSRAVSAKYGEQISLLEADSSGCT
ncbi:MAG: hypothetical protein K2X58_08970, partial [Pseudomonadaceae bacterium]|nr:hypothetical protein [Pseudomonadaceae bacterium]